MLIDSRTFSCEIHTINTTMPFIQLGENYIIVMGKDADGADTDGRIA